jgi:hypothetical protein
MTSRRAFCKRLRPGHEPRHVASKVLAVVIVDVEHPHVLVPGEFLHGAQVAVREIEGGGNGKMSKPVWTDGKAGLHPKLADDEAAITAKAKLAGLWRDKVAVTDPSGEGAPRYIISDHPMTEEEWARERCRE